MSASITSAVPSKPTVTDASRSDLAVGNVVTLTSTTVAATYLWQMVYLPLNSSATLANPTTQNPGTFTVDKVGSYLIALTTDGTSTIYVRLTAKTVGAELLLNAATEQYNPSGTNIPVDIGPTGWTNNLNGNLQALENYSRSLWLWQDLTPPQGKDAYSFQPFLPISNPIGTDVGSVPQGTPHFLLLDGYVAFANDLTGYGQWIDPYTGNISTMSSQWTASNDDTTISSTGYAGASPTTKIQSARWGRGTYYIEVEAQQINGTDTSIGLIATDDLGPDQPFYLTTSTVKQNGVIAYSSNGDVRIGGSFQTTLTPLADGDVLGILIKFVNPDNPSIFAGSNGWELDVYFRINGGAWLNVADPATDTNPFVATVNYTVGYLLGASLDTTSLATATWEVKAAAAILDGDYIQIGTEYLTAGVSWRGRIQSPNNGPQSLGLESNGGPVGVLTGVDPGPPNRAAGEFDASITDDDLRAADIATTINFVGGLFDTTFSATAVGAFVYIVPAVALPWTATEAISFGASMGMSGTRTNYFSYTIAQPNGTVANTIALALESNDNTFGLTAYTVGAQINIHAASPGPGNAVVSTNNGTAFSVANLSGGVSAPILNMKADPSSWTTSTGLPGGTNPWYTNGAFEPNEDYAVPAYFAGPTAAVNVTVTTRGWFTPNGIGRSLLLVTNAAYNGGNVTVSFVRFDTGATETRTVIPVVGGGTVHIEVPIRRLVSVQTASAIQAGGLLSLQIGPYWTPVTAPASNVRGTTTPSPIATTPPPILVVQDVNLGIFQVTPTVVGEAGNMLDLYSTAYPPSPSGDRRYFFSRVYFVVTNDTNSP